MSKLLEIFGRAININTAEVVWHWLNAVKDRYIEQDQLETIDQILDHLGQRKLHLAEEMINEFLAENTESCFGRLVAAAICLHRNQIPGALEQLQSVYLREPANTMALYAMGYCNERTGSESQAVEFYQDCLKFKSFLQLPRQRLAAIYLRNGRLNDTINEYEMLRREYPDDVGSLSLLGYLYIANCQYEDAIELFNMAIAIHPDNFHSQSGFEEIDEMLTEGCAFEAIDRLNAMVEQMGQMPELLVKLADIYSLTNQTAEAVTCYTKAIRMQPNYLQATIKLGTLYLRMRRTALAAEQFNRAVELNDEIVDAYMGLATAQELAGDRQEAFDTLSLAAAIQQNSSLLFAETATLHYQAAVNEAVGQSDEKTSATVLIESVIKAHIEKLKTSPRSADAHYKLGVLLMAQGALEKACKSFAQALEINPTHHRARSKKIICHIEAQDEDSALRLLTDTVLLDSSTLDLHYKTAILYCDSAKFSTAVNILENSFQQAYADTEAAVNISVVLENLGLIDRAVATWDRLWQTHSAVMGGEEQPY